MGRGTEGERPAGSNESAAPPETDGNSCAAITKAGVPRRKREKNSRTREISYYSTLDKRKEYTVD